MHCLTLYLSQLAKSAPYNDHLALCRSIPLTPRAREKADSQSCPSTAPRPACSLLYTVWLGFDVPQSAALRCTALHCTAQPSGQGLLQSKRVQTSGLQSPEREGSFFHSAMTLACSTSRTSVWTTPLPSPMRWFSVRPTYVGILKHMLCRPLF